MTRHPDKSSIATPANSDGGVVVHASVNGHAQAIISGGGFPYRLASVVNDALKTTDPLRKKLRGPP